MKPRWTTKTASSKSAVFLTGMSAVGVAATAALAVRVTPKAVRLLDSYHEREEFKEHAPTVKEDARQVWKLYIPAAIAGAAAVTCSVKANKINKLNCSTLFTFHALGTFLPTNEIS